MSSASRPGWHRRRWLTVGVWLPGAMALPRLGQASAARVLVIGAGWGGLAAANALRAAGQAVEVTVVDREAQWRSLPLSSTWVTGQRPERLPRVPLMAHLQSLGIRFVQAEVRQIDRHARRVTAGAHVLPYDWLVLATGAEGELEPWVAGDAQAAAEARRRWPSGFVAAEVDTVREALQSFRGGELLLTVPPTPYRCPPAPYERAVLLAEWMKARGLPGRITLLDAGAGMPRFSRLFAERWRTRIEHRPFSVIRHVDVARQTVQTDEGTLRFDHALLLPPMRAGRLVAEAGLLGQDAEGRPSRWAAVEGRGLRSVHDERIFVVGDVMDRVSTLFGHYPKTAHVAAELGAAAARQILAAVAGEAPPPETLPAGECHVWLGAEPPEQLILQTQHRRRGDGELVQSVRQTDNPQPRDEDLAWARRLLQQRLGMAAPPGS